jgi:hypothetical protein
MTFNYTLSAIMTIGHREASKVRTTCNTYREALSKGLRKAWKLAKLSLQWMSFEKDEVITEDVNEQWAQQCLGNVEVAPCLQQEHA